MKTLIRRVCCYFSLTVCVHIVHFKKPPHSCSVRSMHCCGMKQKQSQSESAALTFCLQQAANQKAKVQEWKYRAGNGKNISNSKTQPSCHSCFYYHQAEPQACGHWHEHSCRFTHTHTHMLTFARHQWFNEGSHLWSNYAVILSSAWLVASVNWMEPRTT